MNPIQKLIGEAEDLWSDDDSVLDAALGKPEVKTPEEAYEKALLLGKGNVPESYEKLIATDSAYSYWYAVAVLKGRFYAGEPAIATSAEFSCGYARDVMHTRFPMGEPAIAADDNWWRTYKAHFALK